MRPSQVVERFGVLRQFGGALLKEAGRPFEVTGLKGEPAKRVSDDGVFRRQVSRDLRQFQSLPGVVEPIPVELGEPDRRGRVFRVLFQNPLIQIPCFLKGPVSFVDRGQTRQCHRVVGLRGQPVLQKSDRCRVGGCDIERQHSQA